MNASMIIFTFLFLAGSALAQLPSSFFSGFSDGGFPGLQRQQQQIPTPGNGRASTGTAAGGPVLFPMSPDGGETSGVIVGASGYGFIPPGVRMLVQQSRGAPSSSFSGSFNQPFPTSFFNFS